ncbi:M15 family metallopeptidase [Paenibacillus sp. NPDC101420]
MGFEWGGDWTTFKDYPHFQLTFGRLQQIIVMVNSQLKHK